MTLNDLKSFPYLKEKDAIIAGQVETVYNLVFETINGISRFYDNYTMHDMNHGLRVARYMEELAFGLDDDFDANIKGFNALEIALMILSAILHDIGMFIRPEDEREIKANHIKYSNSLTFDGVLKVSKDENEAVKEIVRLTHAPRINEYISYDIKGQTISNILLINGNYSYAEDIASICQAHGEEYSYVKNLRYESTKGSYSYNPRYLAVLLRIADYLDLDKQRTPILWYSMMGITGFSREEWEKHFIIQNEKKLRKFTDGKIQIFFDGKSSNAKIHRKYLRYIDELRLELENADSLLNGNNTDPKYRFNVSTKLEDLVQTEGFKYSDLRLSLDYSSITDLLMGENIYGDKRLGLRELVQNAIDACELMDETKRLDPDIVVPPAIYIVFSKKNDYVKIKDTGIGMTLDVVKKHFLNVGKSYYKSNEYLYKNYNYKPIGQFGIGFLACFLLSDNVTVKTKYYKNNEINQIELEKHSEYVVTNTEAISNYFGTEITLDYSSFFSVFSDEKDVVSFLEKYFITSIPIYIRDDDVPNSTRQITNCCPDLFTKKIKSDSSKTKYERVSLASFSSNLVGEIFLRQAKRAKSPTIRELKSKTYLFNRETTKFELVNALPRGFYDYIEYSDIEPSDYESIVKTKRSVDTKRKELLALTRSKKKELVLLVERGDLFEFPYYSSVKKPSLNDVELEIILQNSGLNYFYELIYDYDCIEDIFAIGSSYLFLQGCVFTSAWRSFDGFDNGKNPFFFYNKGVFVDYFGGWSCPVPMALEAMGFANYLGSDIGLDVSRSRIITGRAKIIKELSLVLLNYQKSREADEDMKKMIEEMLYYYQEEN